MLNFEKDISKIGGWLTKKEASFLYNIAKDLPSDVTIIEIGSWKGRSTICLAKGSMDGNKPAVYAIDPHKGSSEHLKMWGEVDTYNEFLENIKSAGVSEVVIPVRETSKNAAKDFDGRVGFVFIDGAHEFEFVKLDYQLWFPKLQNGGLVVFHDNWHMSGVNLFTALLLITSAEIKNPKLIDTAMVIEKVEKNSFLDRLANILFLFYKLCFGWLGALKLKYFGAVVDEMVKRS